MMLVATTAMAQEQTVKGTVTDQSGEPLIGATIQIPGSSVGAVADLDGNFSISVPAKTKELEVSYVGYKTQRVPVKGQTLKVTMREDTNMMNETVVIGYGSVKKGDLTNAVAQVKGDDLADRPVANLASALQGELAGVEVRSESGMPGGKVTINVRGATSINEDYASTPLYVVDGVPMDDDFDLSQLNTHDIASIEILKDASSSAIYGSRGANGVVIVTSKKGNDNGKTTVNANASFSLSQVERRIDVMSPEEWIRWRTNVINQRYINQYGNKGATVNDDYATRLGLVGNFNTNYIPDPRWSMPNYGGLSLIDWQDEMLRTGYTQNYGVSISSGTKKSSYRASVGYLNQDGIVIETGYRRINARLAGQTVVKEKLTLSTDVSVQFGRTKGGNVDGKDNSMMGALTAVPVAEADADIHTASSPWPAYAYASSNTISPVERMKQNSYTDEQVNLTTSFKAKYQILKELSAELTGSWRFNNRQIKRFNPSSVATNWFDGHDEGYYSSARWQGSRSHKFLGQALARYTKKFGKHSVNAVAGWSVEHTTYGDTYNMTATQFPNNAIKGFQFSDVVLTDANATYTTGERLVSFFGRVEYNWNSRYVVNASLRRDGSSRFGQDNHWGTFPAISGAWRISNEKFWDKHWMMNQAKLRVSYGVNGSNAIPVNAARGMLTSSNYSSDGTLMNGYIPASIDNLDLGWQKTHSWNLGVDMGFFKNRISLAVDYYNKTIKDMLYAVTMPADIGFSKRYSNVGRIRNQGVEVELKTENLTGPLHWTTTFSMGYNKTKVLDLGENTALYNSGSFWSQITEVGHPVGEYYLYEAVGVYKNAEELATYPKETSSTVGSVRYKDQNGDGVIDEKDRVHMGHPTPDFTYGLTNKFTWRNWDFSFMFTAQTGGKIYSALGRAIDRQGMGASINVMSKYQNMWFSEENPGDGYTPCAWNGNTTEQVDSRWLYSSDFLKLKNITLGYKWRLRKGYFVDAVRFTASIENVYMWDKYDGGFSPESNNSGSKTIAQAYDYGAYPLARSFSLGVNVQF